MATVPGEAVCSCGHSPGRGALQAIRFVVIMSVSMAGAHGRVEITPLLAGARFKTACVGILGLGNSSDAGGGGCLTPKESPQNGQDRVGRSR